MNKIRFMPRWKEELVATSDEGTLILEIAMGQLHVYFPDQTKWLNSVPAWATEKWKLYMDACTDWCAENKIPITIVDNTFVYEAKD